MYQIILNDTELNKFIEFLPDLNQEEVYYLCLMGRSKYGASQDATLVRFTSSKEHLKEKIQRLQCPIGSYKRNGIDIASEALALYISLNPRNVVKANKELLIELATAFAEGRTNFNPVSLAHTSIHRSIGRKVFVDFDYDNIEPEQHLPKIKEIISDFRILKTRGGFHLVVPLSNVPKGNWYRELVALDGCDVKGSNTLVPVAGCSQGGFSVRFQ